jgi:hypothetical protein
VWLAGISKRAKMLQKGQNSEEIYINRVFAAVYNEISQNLRLNVDVWKKLSGFL